MDISSSSTYEKKHITLAVLYLAYCTLHHDLQFYSSFCKSRDFSFLFVVRTALRVGVYVHVRVSAHMCVHGCVQGKLKVLCTGVGQCCSHVSAKAQSAGTAAQHGRNTQDLD